MDTNTRLLCDAAITLYRRGKRWAEDTRRKDLEIVHQLEAAARHPYQPDAAGRCQVCGRVDRTLNLGFHTPESAP